MGILKGYVNKENNSNRIYSREDVGKMSSAEYSKNEKAIDHQMRTVGVPTNNDLKNSSDVVYVSAYKRADGTEVSAYYRSKPDGIGSSSNPGNLVPQTDPPTGGDLVPDGSNPIDKILNFLKGDYTGESILPTDGESPLDKIGSGDIVSQILNMIAGGNTGVSGDENILQKILGGATTDGNNNDIVSTLLSVLSGGNAGDLEKVFNPNGNGGVWDEKIPKDGTEGSTIPDLSSMTNPISAILDYINTGEFDINKLLPMPGDNGGVLDEKPRYPWDERGTDDDKNKSKKDKDEEEKNKVNPLADLLNYAFTGEFNKDEFIEHTVRSVMDNDMLGSEQENDPNREMLLKMVKQSNEAMNKILDGITNLLPEDSQVTGVVKGLVQYAKSAGQQLETMLDPEKMQEQMIQEVSQYITDFTDFTGQLLSGDFENIDWAEVGQKLHVSEIAAAINPIAGVIATLAVDVAPKVVKIVEASNSGDKAELIQNAIGAFTNCMGVIGQLKSAVGNKLAEFSKDVDAKVFDEASQTYQNLEQIQDAGYKYETYVKAEMFDQANQEALKLNDLSTDMMQGKATGYATNIDSIDVDAITNDNYQPSTTVLQGGISKTDYPDVNTEVPNVQNPQTTDWGDSAIMASQISNAINSIMNNSQNAENLNVSASPQFNTSIEAIKQAQTVQKNNLDNLLKKVTTAKNQEEYSKLLKEYAQKKEQYQKTQDLTSQLDYASQNKDYQGVTQAVKNYMQQGSGTLKGSISTNQPAANQNFGREHYNNKLNELINNALGIQPASAEEMPTGFASGVGNTAKNKSILSQLSELEMQRDKRDIGNINSLMKNDNPKINKKALDFGIPTMNTVNGNKFNDAKGLWETASYNFQNTDYINKNADIVNSVSDFGNDNLSKQISNKLQSQFGIKDAKGLVFYPNSELSIEMSNSQEIKDFISKNKNILSSGKIIKNSSVSFNSNKDLYFGIHNADVINAKINQNGDFQAIVLDTYDFNKNSTNPLVKMARNVQDAKMLTPYYTINFVYIPREKLQKYYGF